MIMLDYLFPGINTALLVILFFYQRNRNKVLEEHLASQRQLIDETKSVVTQQSTALEGQGRVVDAALKYSSAFDSKRLEEVLRREIGIDHREEIDRLKREIEAKAEAPSSQSPSMDTLLNVLVDVAANAATKVTGDIITPLVPHVLRSLLATAPSERAAAAADVQPEHLRKTLLDAVASIDAKVFLAANK